MIEEMNFFTEREAKEKKLVPITEYLEDTDKERAYLLKMKNDITGKAPRQTMFVMCAKGSGDAIALFANNLCAKQPARDLPKGIYKSKSGKFKNLLHLCESIFHADKDLTFDKFKKMIRKEFPKSAMLNSDRDCRLNFNIYRHRLAIQGRFQYIATTKRQSK
jgi:hypothetical protein